VFSMQTIFGSKDKVLDLLQTSTETTLEAATAAHQLTQDWDNAPHIATFTASRQREKELAIEISEELINTFFTVLDREDVESMNAALYKIPKKIERFAQRYIFVHERLSDVDFSERTEILLGCAQMINRMVSELRNGLRLDPMRDLQRQLQALESEADDLLLEPYRDLYLTSNDPMRVMLAKDLFEILEKAIDACRDVGNIIYSIVLKNS